MTVLESCYRRRLQHGLHAHVFLGVDILADDEDVLDGYGDGVGLLAVPSRMTWAKMSWRVLSSTPASIRACSKAGLA